MDRMDLVELLVSLTSLSTPRCWIRTYEHIYPWVIGMLLSCVEVTD